MRPGAFLTNQTGSHPDTHNQDRVTTDRQPSRRQTGFVPDIDERFSFRIVGLSHEAELRLVVAEAAEEKWTEEDVVGRIILRRDTDNLASEHV